MTNGQRSTANGQPPRIRRILGISAIVAIVALRFDYPFIRLLFVDRAPISAFFAARPNRLWPRYAAFLDDVRASTRNGDSVALIAPTVDWDNGYSYAYYRASYVLAGREVLPIADSRGGLHPENFRRARYVAVFGREMPPGNNVVVWRSDGGLLLRR